MQKPPSIAPRARNTLDRIDGFAVSLLAHGQAVATLPTIAEQLVKELADGALPTPQARRTLDLAEEHTHKLGWACFLALRQRTAPEFGGGPD